MRFAHCGAQVGYELGSRDCFALSEFPVAFANVGRLADAGDDPLADVAAEMQDEVADTVRGVVGAPPDFVVGELREALGDAALVAFEGPSRFGEEKLGEVVLFSLGLPLPGHFVPSSCG